MIKDLDSYRHGFIAGLDIKENNKTMIFGMDLNEILDILEQHLKDKVKMSTKHIMTRAEAIACFKKHMPDAGRAEPVIDFYVAAGMLEIKEEEKPIFELRYPSGAFAYKIWANGRVEGFNENIIVINRIPELIAKVKAK